jgi:hypothetical protein
MGTVKGLIMEKFASQLRIDFQKNPYPKLLFFK